MASSTAGWPTTVVLDISGDLDEKFRAMLTDCLTRLASKRADRLVLDLSNVNCLDRWSAVAILVAVRPGGLISGGLSCAEGNKAREGGLWAGMYGRFSDPSP